MPHNAVLQGLCGNEGGSKTADDFRTGRCGIMRVEMTVLATQNKDDIQLLKVMLMMEGFST